MATVMQLARTLEPCKQYASFRTSRRTWQDLEDWRIGGGVVRALTLVLLCRSSTCAVGIEM